MSLNNVLDGKLVLSTAVSSNSVMIETEEGLKFIMFVPKEPGPTIVNAHGLTNLVERVVKEVNYFDNIFVIYDDMGDVATIDCNDNTSYVEIVSGTIPGYPEDFT